MKNNISALPRTLFKPSGAGNTPIIIRTITLKEPTKIRLKNVLAGGGGVTSFPVGKLTEAELTKIGRYSLSPIPQYAQSSNVSGNYRILYEAISKYASALATAGVGLQTLTTNTVSDQSSPSIYSDVINVGSQPISAVTFGTLTVFTFDTISYENSLTMQVTDMKVGDLIKISGLSITATIAAGASTNGVIALSQILNGEFQITEIAVTNGAYSVTVNLDTSNNALTAIAGASVTVPALVTSSLENQNAFVIGTDGCKMPYPPKYIGYILNLVIAYNADLSSLYQTILNQTCTVEIENGGE